MVEQHQNVDTGMPLTSGCSDQPGNRRDGRMSFKVGQREHARSAGSVAQQPRYRDFFGADHARYVRPRYRWGTGIVTGTETAGTEELTPRRRIRPDGSIGTDPDLARKNVRNDVAGLQNDATAFLLKKNMKTHFNQGRLVYSCKTKAD